MGAYSIFICHDCKLATGDAEGTSWPYVNKDKGLEKFKKEHPGHDVKVSSDAHGQIDADQYDFEKREFKFDGYY